MSNRTFNNLFTIAAIVFLIMTVVMVIVASHKHATYESMSIAWVIVWASYAAVIFILSMYYGSKDEKPKKTVYYLRDEEE